MSDPALVTPASPPPMARPPRRSRLSIVLAAFVTAVVVAAIALGASGLPGPSSAIVSPPTRPPITDAPGSAGPQAPFTGLGAWVDLYSYAPAYVYHDTQAVTPTAVGSMAGFGVRTLFLQAAGARTDGELVSTGLLESFLAQAHSKGMRVVGWYQPSYTSVAADLGHLEAMAAFNEGGQHFDGIAIDMEAGTNAPPATARTRDVVALSEQLRASVGADYPLAAIVIPPVILTSLNPQAWPDFPWKKLAPLYDTWIPMSYWTFRDAGSQLADPQYYTQRNITETRALLGQPDAAVYALGGVAGKLTVADYQSFLAGARAGHAVGVGIYNYRLTSTAGMTLLSQAVPPGGFPAAAQQLRGQ